jgi:hypothetical protein
MKMDAPLLTNQVRLTSSPRKHLDRSLQSAFSGVHDNILLVIVHLHDLSR